MFLIEKLFPTYVSDSIFLSDSIPGMKLSVQSKFLKRGKSRANSSTTIARRKTKGNPRENDLLTQINLFDLFLNSDGLKVQRAGLENLLIAMDHKLYYL